MEVFNALDLKSGKKAKMNKMGSLTQPIQFLPDKEKDDDWRAWNLDWHEAQGMEQLRRNAKRLLKNYKLAKGIIDKSDYIVQEDNEYSDIVETLTREDDSALELKFYPIIPNIINVLCTEFSKRVSKMDFIAVDELSYNEMLEAKREMIDQTLLATAHSKMINRMLEMGLDPESEEAQQMISEENLKKLPEIQDHFAKGKYRALPEEWARHQMNVDQERFRMAELEERGFRDSLITDREFWHFMMLEDDYIVELWNPVTTFYHKSPSKRYTSDSNYVGNIDLMSISDVIDRYGWRMTAEQMQSLENIYPSRSAGYIVPGKQNDGSFYDATRSHEWNTAVPPSLAMRQHMSIFDAFGGSGDVMEWILSESEDLFDTGNQDLLRVTTLYWKTQRKIGHLTKITEEGEIIQKVVDENYKVIDKPVYDTTIYKIKDKDNLIFGEHIDWMWPNEAWGGVKIGPNRPATWNHAHFEDNDCEPIYLGITTPKPGRLKFQFKGDDNIFGCKLPVEGCVFSDRNTRSVALVDNIKPFQLGFNMVNNQVADILVDELGTVILLDQNALPRHSMGEDWGKGNLTNAYLAMKNFSMLPVDTSIMNTENALNFQHYQVLNLEQSQRLLSRVQLANYFKQEAFAVVGLSPERMAQMTSQQTATGVEQAVNASYAQTEVYFTQHCDYLMPRVHEMRTNLAQFYNATKPSVRLQYVTSLDEKVNFEIEGTKLMLRDLNIFSTTRTNARQVVDQLKQLALNNNTTGASIYDLGNLVKADSIAEIDRVLKAAEEKINAQRAAEMKQTSDLEQQAIQAEYADKERARQMEAIENEKDRQADILIAEIRATAMIGSNKADMDGNSQNDQVDAMNQIQEQENYRNQTQLEREKEINNTRKHQEEMNLKRQELQTKREVAQKELEVARENKNKYDTAQRKKPKN